MIFIYDDEPFSDIYHHFQGDTLIHSVAARGDSHGEILETVEGNSVFDLSRCNYDGQLNKSEIKA